MTQLFRPQIMSHVKDGKSDGKFQVKSTVFTSALLVALNFTGFQASSAAPGPTPLAAQVSPAKTPDQIWTDFQDTIKAAKQAMMANPADALSKAQNAGELANLLDMSTRKREAVATALWLRSEALIRVNRVSEVPTLIERALNLVGASGAETRLVGDLRLVLARAERQDGNVSSALANLHRAYETFVLLEERRSQAITLQGIGSIYNDAHSFERALEYYERAHDIFPSDPSLELSAANNSGNAFKELERYDEAITEFTKALAIGDEMGSPYLQGRIMTNIASVHFLNENLDAATASTDKAMAFLNKADDMSWKPFVWGIKAQIAMAQDKKQEAATLIAKVFSGRDLAATTFPFRDMHEIAYKIFQTSGNMAHSLEHIVAFKRLDDQGRAVAASAAQALASARFDSTNRELRIARLKTEKLEDDMTLAAVRANQKIARILIALTATLLMLIAIYALSSRKHNKVLDDKNKKLNKSLHDLNKEITKRQKVEENLHTAREQAEMANEAKSRFLANMHHELRTPLNAIIGFSDLISTEALGEVGTREYKEYAGDIHESGISLLAALTDILEIARLDNSEIERSEVEINLNDLVSHSIRSFNLAHKNNSRTIELTTPDEELLIMGDEQILHRALKSLISNSYAFTGEHGHINVSTERLENGDFAIVVEDDGVGICGKQMETIMEPFGYTADPYTRSNGGIGLGLPLVRSSIEVHNGHFRIESEPGKGTRAIIQLPAAATRIAAA